MHTDLAIADFQGGADASPTNIDACALDHVADEPRTTRHAQPGVDGYNNDMGDAAACQDLAGTREEFVGPSAFVATNTSGHTEGDGMPLQDLMDAKEQICIFGKTIYALQVTAVAEGKMTSCYQDCNQSCPSPRKSSQAGYAPSKGSPSKRCHYRRRRRQSQDLPFLSQSLSSCT
jgi:hypothetical protein